MPLYEIVATLGPASTETAIWREMLDIGVTGFRLNTSHMSLSDVQRWLDRLMALRSVVDGLFSVVLDLQGSKWRLGEFPPCTLTSDQIVDLVYAPEAAQSATLPVPHPDFFRAADNAPGHILLNDAKLRLAIESVVADRVRARVLVGGQITPRKGITLPGAAYRQEALSPRDQQIWARSWA